MKRTHAWLSTGIIVLCALGARWWVAQAPSTVAETPPLASPSAPAVASAASPASVDAVSDPEPRPQADPAPVAARIDPRSDPVLEQRARQHELAPEADARWQQAVDEAGYTASDLDASVRDLFRRIDLEPRYAEGGRIDGLVITSMAPDHPFARLGFRSGDRIDRIQGVALRDPAEIPSLLARLGPNFDLCVDRQGAELCGEVHLE